MTFKERILRTMKGEPVDEIPWVPRMDLWYIANRERGDLKNELNGLNTVEIARHFDFACHAVQADYTVPRSPDALVFRGLGFDLHPDYPYGLELDGLPVDFSVNGETVSTSIETSKGPVSFILRQSASMRREGISLPFVISHPVEQLDDLARVNEVFDHLKVVPSPASYKKFFDRIGDRGVAVARGCIAASPMHLLLHELMPMDLFFYWYHDHYKELCRFSERISPFFMEILNAVMHCEAEAVLWGSNFDRDLTWPPFFIREISPWLNTVRDRLHSCDKILICHTDGENNGLFGAYHSSRFDVAESVCPSPMTELTLTEIRRQFGVNTVIWGGIPSVALLPDSLSHEGFKNFISNLVAELAGSAPDKSRVILGVSDNVPPDADLSRLAVIGDTLQGKT